VICDRVFGALRVSGFLLVSCFFFLLFLSSFFEKSPEIDQVDYFRVVFLSFSNFLNRREGDVG